MSKQEIPALKEFVDVVDLGVLAYKESLDRQFIEHQRVVDGGKPVFILVEHPPVLTLGKNADLRHLKSDFATLTAQGVSVIETDRGGEVTAHVPGQLVVYPIIPITRLGLSPRRYVNLLEEAVIRVLKGYDLESGRDAEHPGVWVGTSKVCALGIRIRTRVAMHGLALNVNNDFELFESIIPCGIHSRGVTSIQKELGHSVPLNDVKLLLVEELYKCLFLSAMERC